MDLIKKLGMGPESEPDPAKQASNRAEENEALRKMGFKPRRA